MSLNDSDDLEQPLENDFRVIFIVGPAGIGKSTLLNKFMKNAGARFKPIWLDSIAIEEGLARGLTQDQDPSTAAFSLLNKVGHHGLVVTGITALFRRLRAATDGEIYLVDVGSAFQDVAVFASLSLLHPVIGIIASEEAAFERFCKYRPIDLSFDMYKEVEYRQDRREVYESATHLIDTTNLSIDETVIRFGTVVQGIANRQPMIDNQGSNSKLEMQFLHFATYQRNALDNPGPHWQDYKHRWQYYSRAIEIAKTLDVNNPSDVLELGPAGVSIVPNCMSIDYDEAWNFKKRETAIPSRRPRYSVADRHEDVQTIRRSAGFSTSCS